MSNPSNPYLDARKEWLERYGSYIKRESTWRLVAIVMTIGCTLSSCGLYQLKADQKILTYVIEVNEHGEVGSTRKVEATAQPNEKIVRAQLLDWIRGRTVYVDAKAIKHINERTYAATLPGSAAHRELDQFFEANNPYARATKETVDVVVRSAMPLSDSNTWRVEWEETVRQRSGKVVSVVNWQATITVTIATPTTQQQVLSNPFGVFVSQFSWAERL